MKKAAGLAQAVAKKKAMTPSKASPKKKAAPAAKALLKAKAERSAPGSGRTEVLDRLYSVIMDRRTADPAHSHSARLLSRGLPKVAQKFGEEAVECLIEAVAGNSAALIGESADVLYHLLVMWVACGVSPDQVWAELERREGVSGVDEKASRLRQGTAKIP